MKAKEILDKEIKFAEGIQRWKEKQQEKRGQRSIKTHPDNLPIRICIVRKLLKQACKEQREISASLIMHPGLKDNQRLHIKNSPKPKFE